MSLLAITAIACRPLTAQGGFELRAPAGETLASAPGIADRFADSLLAIAIARFHAQLAALHASRYHVAVSYVVTDLRRLEDSSSSIAMFNESRSVVSWPSPTRYRETILAHRGTNRLSPLWTTISIPDIVGEPADRIIIQTSVLVSPIAVDAGRYYRYRFLGRAVVDGRAVLRVAVSPRSKSMPLFTGIVDLSDSSCDVVGIDVTVDNATPFAPWGAIRYQLRFGNASDGQWTPREIRLTGEGQLALKLPTIPQRLGFEQVARFSGFQFDSTRNAALPTEVRVVVARDAARADTAAWSAPDSLSVTDADRDASRRIDTGSHRSSLIDRVRDAAGSRRFVGASADFFHFNRVDGAYVGAGESWRATPSVTANARVGFATGSERWQYRVGGMFRLVDRPALWAGISYHDETVSRASLLPHATDPTIDALLFRRDPLDYYRERGATLSLTVRPLAFTELGISYQDQQQSAVPVVTDFSLFQPREPPPQNGIILPGQLRSLATHFIYDSRSVQRRGAEDVRLPSLNWTRVTLSAEFTLQQVIPDDFNFGRYSIQVERTLQSLDWGTTSVNLVAGVSTGVLPPQRYFTIDFGMRALGFQGSGFRNVSDSSFAGNRVAILSIRHDFGQRLFAGSGLPVLRQLPITLSVYGGVFAIGFADHVALAGDALYRATTRPYTEAGFALGDLLPFLAPLDVGAQFTWQFSSQFPTPFQFGLTLTRRSDGLRAVRE